MFKAALKAILPPATRLAARRVYARIEPALYTGWSVECPCCGARYRDFLPHRFRSHARCGRCDSVERHRLLHLYLKEKTNLFTEPLRLLHFAPEPIFHRLFSSLPNLQYFTTDFCEKADVNMDITQLAMPANVFDAIICIHVLEHIPDDHAAMSEMCRVLKPGGWAALQVPLDAKREQTYEDWSITDPEARLQHFGQADHVRRYGRDYGQRLQRAGFDVTVDSYAREMPPEQSRRYGLMLDEDVYLCRK